jgi:hypothetical protein
VRRTWAVGLAVVFLLLGPVCLQAQAQSPVKISLTAGYDQRYLPGRSVPVSVLLESTRAVAGDLEVSSRAADGSNLVKTVSVEVPAGGKKKFDLTVAAPSTFPSRLQVALRNGGRELGTAQVDLVATGNQLLVGVLSDALPAGLAGFRVEPTANEVRGVLVPPDWPGLGRQALEPLSYLVVDSDQARAMPTGYLASVFDWVVAGGRLVVAARDPTDLGWIPEAWRTTWTRQGSGWALAQYGKGKALGRQAGAATAGLGQVIVVPAALEAMGGAPGLWEAVLRPAPSSAASSPDMFGTPSVDFELVSALTSQDRSAVGLKWFVFFLVAYLLAAGPVNYLVLRKLGRKELAWITIPALAAVFSLVAYGLVRGTRGGIEVQQASLVLATADGYTSDRVVTVSTAAGGRRVVGLTSNDAAEPWGIQPWGPGPAGQRRLVSRITRTGTEAVIETSPFSIGIAQGSLPASPGFLDAVLTWDGKDLVGKVTNRTKIKLEVEAVASGRKSVSAGALMPGASAELDLGEWLLAPARAFSPFMGGPSRIGSKANMKYALGRQLGSLVGPQGSFGVPMVVGYAGDFAPQLSIDGVVKRPPGPVIVASPARVVIAPGASGRVPAAAGRLELVKVDGGAMFDGTVMQLQNFREAVFAFALPQGIPPERVSSAVVESGADGPQYRTEVFDFGQRRWVGGDGAVGLSELPISTSTLSDAGEIYVRMTPAVEPYLELWSLGVELTLK